jgi:hypothetical protein
MGTAIQANGGLFAKDLDRDVTHVLICGDTVGREPLELGSRIVESEKAMWARKINSERKKKASQKHGDKDVELIHVIWEEWFWDCMTYEGMLTSFEVHQMALVELVI